MATKAKKTTATTKRPRAATASKRATKTKATVPSQDQFTSVMIPIFAVLSVIFLLAVIQNYV